MSGHDEDGTYRLISALMRSRRKRLAAAAALIVIATSVLCPTAAWSLDEARGDVLYVGAPGVSYPSAREAGAASRHYLGDASRETLFALGFTEEEIAFHDSHRALASISESPEEDAAYPTPDAALQAGDEYLAQAGQSLWNEDEAMPDMPEDKQFASSDTERVRPELGNGRMAPADGEESLSVADEEPEDEPGVAPQSLEAADEGIRQEGTKYASVEPNISERAIVEPSIPEPEVTEEDATEPEEPEEGAIEQIEPEMVPDEPPEAPDSGAGEEFASLAVPQAELEEPSEFPSSDEGVLSDEVAPMTEPEESVSEELAPESEPFTPPPVHDPLVVSQAPPPPPEVTETAAAPSTESQDDPSMETPDDPWATMSTETVSVEGAVGDYPIHVRPEPVGGRPTPSSADPTHEPLTSVPQPHRPQPEEPLPTEPPTGASPDDASVPPADEELPEDEAAHGDSLGDGGSLSEPPTTVAPETPPEEERPAPGEKPEDEGEPDRPGTEDAPDRGSGSGDDARPSPERPPSDARSPGIPVRGDDDSPERVEPSVHDQRLVSRSEVVAGESSRVHRSVHRHGSPSDGSGATDGDRAMIRVRPIRSDAHAGYELDRILPGGTVEPIYEGSIGFEEAVAIGASAGGAPPQQVQPTQSALDEAEAELALYRSSKPITTAPESGVTAPSDVAPPVVSGQSGSISGGASRMPAGTQAANPATPDVGGTFEAPVGDAGFQLTHQVVEPTVPDREASVPVDTTDLQSQITSEPLPATQAPYGWQPIIEQVAPERAVSEETSFAQPSASGTVDVAPPVVEPPVPSQPPVETTPEAQVPSEDAHLQQIQPVSQLGQTMQPTPTVPVASPVAAVPSSTPSPQPQATGWSGQSQTAVQEITEQPATASVTQTSVPTNVQTNESVTGGAI